MTFLQRALLSPQLSLLPPTGWLLCFQEVMFPLMENLLKGSVEVLPPPPSSKHKLDSAGLEETRLRAAALLSKIFLQYLPKLTTLPNFSQLWLDILRFMEAIRTGGKPILRDETIRMMMRDHVGPGVGTQGPGWGFGYGWAVLSGPLADTPQRPGTVQWGGAYGHSFFLDPTERLTVVALTNTAFEGTSGRFPGAIRDAAYRG